MGVDLELLAQHHRFEDPAAGYSEEFIQPRLGLGNTVAVLSTPLGPSASLGWVICHSFALEHVYLQPMETALARRLAATGFAVLRFHAQGYGDSELDSDQVTLHSHVEDTLDAASVLASPLINERQLGRVLGFIERAQDEGAKLVTGGRLPPLVRENA